MKQNMSVGFFALVCLMAGCAHFLPKKETAPIRVHFQEQDVLSCAYLGEVVGSAGHWYSAWFLNNDDLINGALDDMRSQAHARGADTLFVAGNTLNFQTSVTLLGQAYRCSK